MALSPGHRFGPYEIVALVGAGGMGEVYKGRDTRLDRTVAIKVSNKEFSERFQREVHAIASLNHPNICTLHDVGPDYLVMEFIDGNEIKGPLPVDEALRLAMQIAEAVEHAHQHGVIHRDLKPGNILVAKSGVKVLDFGLAKLSRAASASDASQTELEATMTQGITQQGMIVGTPRYMAPEQLEGQEADRRSDVFAFGLVLYEMITGRPAFEGKTNANIIAAILAAEPKPITSYQPLIPPALDHLIKTCLEKDPNGRRQSMHDVLLELRWIAENPWPAAIPNPAIAHRKYRERLAWIAVVVVSAAAVALAVIHFRETPAPVYPVRFEQPVAPKTTFAVYDIPAASPDGQSFAYTGAMGGTKQMLWVRRLSARQPVELAGAENARSPFWSPDSRSIAYFANGKVHKIEAAGGPPQVICDTPSMSGGTWNNDGIILLGRGTEPIHKVSAAGGEAKPLLKLDAARKEIRQTFPHFLPDGRHFLFVSVSGEPARGEIYLGSLDSEETRLVLNTASNVSVVAPGLLLFGRGRVLMAQQFDLKKLQVNGAAFPVADELSSYPTQVQTISMYSASRNGVLVYRSAESSVFQVSSYDRSGKRTATIGEPRLYQEFALSSDEKWLAVQVGDPRGGDSDIWRLNLASGILSRVTSDGGNKDTVVWSPDGREILFSANKTGVPNLYRKSVGGGEAQPVQTSVEPLYPAEWLKDGSFLYLNRNGRSFLRLKPGSQPETLLKTDYSKDAPRVSPDGRWVAYNTDESGRWEVYIASFPAFTERRQVSNTGGVQSFWRKDGKELFYISLDGNVMAVPIQPGDLPETGIPKVLFATRTPVNPTSDQFAVTGDGQKFLVIESMDAGEPKPVNIVLNWPAASRTAVQ